MIRDSIEKSIQTALSNRGLIKKLIEGIKPYAPPVYAIRLTMVVNSGIGLKTKVMASVYPDHPQAQAYVDIFSKDIEEYLNTYYELYPQQVGGDTVSYNHFQFIIDIPVSKE